LGVADRATIGQQYHGREPRVALHLYTLCEAVAHDSDGFARKVQYSFIRVVRKRYIGRAGCERTDAVCKMLDVLSAARAEALGDPAFEILKIWRSTTMQVRDADTGQ
jgi:hypothetical protein